MTTLVVVLLAAAAFFVSYIMRAGKAKQLLKDEAARADKRAQADLTRKALGTRPARRDE